MNTYLDFLALSFAAKIKYKKKYIALVNVCECTKRA